MTPSLINSGLSVGTRFADESTYHEYSAETMDREAELIRQSEAAFAERFAAGLVGFTELCREAGMPHRQIKACRDAIGLSVDRREVFAALASTLPSDIVRAGSVSHYVDAYLREIAADAGLLQMAEAAE